LLRGVRLAQPGRPLTEPVDLVLADGLIAAVVPAGQADPSGLAPGTKVQVLDGWLVTSALAEPHAHLDKALTVDRVVNRTGDLDGAVAGWMAVDAPTRYGDLVQRAVSVIRREAAAGVTALRTHVDTGALPGLDPTRTLLALRHDVAPLVDLQVFPSFGLPITGPDGAPTRRLIAEALELGVDGLGGAPNLDPDPVAALDIVLKTVKDARVPLDLHTDETLDPDHFLLELIAERAPELGVPVTVDHVCSLAVQPAVKRTRVAQRLAAAGVKVVTLPQTNLYLQGRQQRSPVARGLTAVRDLLDAGVTVAGGGDNVGDAFNLVSRADPLETASLLVAAAHLDLDQALELVTTSARAALGRPPVRLEAGAPADLLVTKATTVQELIAFAPVDRLVFKAGHVTARTEAATTLAPLATPLQATYPPST
jgi:cytosine deaminase